MIPTNNICFFNNVSDGPSVVVLRISKDGIWVNPDVPADEAAKKVLEALDHNIKFMLAHERERLAQSIEQMPFGDTAQSFANYVREFK